MFDHLFEESLNVFSCWLCQLLFFGFVFFFSNKLSIIDGPRSKLHHLSSILNCVCELNVVTDTNLNIMS